MNRIWVIFVAASLFACAAYSADYVWWEGETPTETNFPARTSFSPHTFPETADRLSNGDWLTNEGQRGDAEAFAVYEVVVPDAGTYDLWARKFWKHGPFKWRFGDATWQICDRDIALADDAYLRTHLGANWVYLGSVTLPEGVARMELCLLAEKGETLTAAFDAFILTQVPFMPNGKLKPGEKSGLADEGYFPFEPGLDAFSDDALLDLRALNETNAGENGFVRRDGMTFVLGDGTPVRFWGVNVSANNAGQDRKSVDYLARKLAKLGVNAVRYHSPLFDDADGDPAKLDPKRLDDLHYLVAAMKRQGIYTTLSFYFPLWFDIKPTYGIPGYDAIENKKPFALLFFDERMREIYEAWARQLLTTPNPYTGVPLAREPAIALVELQNEDSFFFWTFTKRNIPDVHWRKLETMFSVWLAGKYGSLEQTFAAWKSATSPDDDTATGRVAIFEAWHMTRAGIEAGGEDKARRIGDQVRFLTELQHGFYVSMTETFRKEFGVRSLISPSNWHVADRAMLDALERHTYTAGDVLDGHGYFGGKHQGDGAGYSVRVGHTYEDSAAVLRPDDLPIQVFQTEGYPHILSEIGWHQPNRYRADMTFLSSAYGSLQGLDGFFFFAVNSNFLLDSSMSKFGLGTPAIVASFPAMALQYRRGDVKEAGNAVYQALKLDDLYTMKGSGGMSAQALDEIRKQDVPSANRSDGNGTPPSDFDPLSFYVGRVVRTLEENPTGKVTASPEKYVHRTQGSVISATRELLWDIRNGIATVDTPNSQGAAGFLSKSETLQLTDVVFQTEMEFGSISVISLDGLPIASSRKLLVQAMTEDRPYGFRTDGNIITQLGGAPFGVKKADATVAVQFGDGGEITVLPLDANGYPMGEPAATNGDGVSEPLTFRLREDAVYHVILRR